MQEEEKYTQFIEIGGELEDINTDAVVDLKSGKVVSDEQLRMAIANRQVNGKDAGVNLVYGNNESIQVHLFLRQGNQTARVSTTATVITNDKGKKILRNSITGIPNQINLSQGGVKVTGVVGVKNPRVEGGKFLADVPNIKDFLSDPKNSSYVLPMFFPETEVQTIKTSAGGTKYGFFGRFQLYGSIVGVPMNNVTDTKFTLYNTALVTSAFDTEGTMDLTNTIGSTLPTWKTTQTDAATKVVDVPTKAANTPQGFNAKQKNWYFFWVKPKQTNITSNTKLSVSLRSFAGTEYNFEVPVKKVLAEQRVHRIPEVQLPLMPDLIISEVYRFDEEHQVAYEFYNCSDHPVNLWNYQMKSSNGSVSPLLQYNRKGGDGTRNSRVIYGPGGFPQHPGSDDRCVFNRTLQRVTPIEYRRQGATDINTSGKAMTPAFLADDLEYYMETKVILQPGEMALFVEQSVKYTPSIVKVTRNNLPFTINFGTDFYKGFHVGKGGYVELQRRRRNKEGKYLESAVTMDAFLKFKPATQSSFQVWAYTMMRKPDRNTPRQYMQLGSDTDWVVRRGSEDIDWGYRFGYEQTGTTLETIKWFDGSGWDNGYEKQGHRPMCELKQLPSSHSYYHAPPAGSNTLYLKFPNNWKRTGDGIAH